MEKRLILTLVLAFVCSTLPAKDGKPSFTYGAEWGYCAKILEFHKFTYYDEYGSLVPDNKTGLSISGNGYFLLNAGLDFGRRSSVCIQSGYMGISENRRVIPVMLKYVYAPCGHGSDGMLLSACGGIGFPMDKTFNRLSIPVSVGTGYRFYLGNGISVDLTCSVRVIYDHPGVFDSASGKTVDSSRIRRNNAMYGAINFGIGINF